MEWLSGLTDWFVVLFQGLWNDGIEFLNDFWIGIVQQILSLIANMIVSIPVPSFIANYSLGQLILSIPPDVLYFVSYLRLGESFALIGAGVSFRLGRKVLTLFQW